MCGILSALSSGRPLDEGRLREGLRALRHRGPDGSGLWLSGDGAAALGHARLSIIDLETGAQPIASEDGSLHIAVNGEFYGFEAIRGGLEARGHRFRTRSDSEIALHLYEERGPDCLSDLRGEFAFVVYDEREKTLFAARDRFGIKPLCYAVHEGTLFVASEAKALFAAGVPAAWDEEAFYFAAGLQYVPADRTLFKGIRQLRPGHFLTADRTGVRERRYWDLDYPIGEGGGDERELTQEFTRRLEESVRLRLRADAPVCCHLSGGIDSSAVLALAARHSPAPMHCFTVSFGEAPYDELAAAREMAAHAGARLHEVPVSAADIAGALPDAVYFSEGLTTNGHLSAKFLLSKAIREAGFKAVLTGEGADELVAGYAHLREDLWAGRESELTALRASNRLSGDMLCLEAPPRLEGIERSLGFVPSFLGAKALMGERLRPLLKDPAPERFLESFGDADQLAGRHRVNQSSYLWCKSALANYILRTLGDGAEMAHSIEGRLPYLDHRLFEFARALPISMKIRGSVEKYILREAVRPLVTEAVYRRQKQPFTAPPAGAEIEDFARGRSFGSIPFFDARRVREFLDMRRRLSDSERAAFDPALMTVLSAAILHERYGL